MNDWIDILAEPLDASATNRVLDENAGGVATFLGITRSEVNAAGQSLVALDYEAYFEMALKQMRDLAERARSRWPIIKLVLLHRVGRVALAEPSVLIAVSTPHRGEAFEACRFLIDTLKAEVAIWKKEIWADGTGSWIHPAVENVMSKRAVWIIAIVLLGLSVLSVIYSIADPNQIPFDQVAWISASSEADYAKRNQMINDVEHRIDDGELKTDGLVREKLGAPETIDSQTGNWYYRLGSPGGQSSNRRLELAFEKTGRVLSRRVVSAE